MKLWILSDLHLEFRSLDDLDLPDADVCVVAGDVLEGGLVPSIDWVGEKISRHMPTIFVPGNHDFYGGFMDDSVIAAAERVEKVETAPFPREARNRTCGSNDRRGRWVGRPG